MKSKGSCSSEQSELQKVMEKKTRPSNKQKEEEAQKKKSDLENRAIKNKESWSSFELEKQKLQKSKKCPKFEGEGNLRRTGQEVQARSPRPRLQQDLCVTSTELLVAPQSRARAPENAPASREFGCSGI